MYVHYMYVFEVLKLAVFWIMSLARHTGGIKIRET